MEIHGTNVAATPSSWSSNTNYMDVRKATRDRTNGAREGACGVFDDHIEGRKMQYVTFTTTIPLMENIYFHFFSYFLIFSIFPKL